MPSSVRLCIASFVYLVLAGCAASPGPSTNDTAAPAPRQLDVAALTERAAAGDPEAQYVVGMLYLQGKGGVPRRGSEAAKWLGRAAEQNHLKSQLVLAHAYRQGIGVSLNYTESLRWSRRAAEQGNGPAMVLVGESYQKGFGTTQDYREAATWYRRAADKGEAGGRTRLAALHLTGRGVAKDHGEAVRLYELAAAQNYAPAQISLGLLYAGGVGVVKDPVTAYMWYVLGTEQEGKKPHEQGLTHKKALEATLSTEQRDQARRRAEQWRTQLPPAKGDST